MSQTVVGLNGFSEQPKRRQKIRGSGWVTIRTWHGPRAKVDECISDTVTPLDPEDINVVEGTPAVIEATFVDDESSQSASTDPFALAEDEAVWELIWSPLEKALGTHGYFQPSSGNLVALGAQEAIQKAIRDGTAYSTDWNSIYSGQGFDHAQDFSNLLLKGTDTWRTWTPVIRKTMSVGRRINFNIDNPDAQKVIEYNAIGLPPDVKWAQPKMRLYVPQVGWGERAFNEWLTSPANITYRRKKHEIVWEWIGAVRWYACLYEGGTALTSETGFE